MALRCGRGSDRWDFRTLSSTSDDSVWIAGFQSQEKAGNIQKLAYRVRGSEFASRRCAGTPLRFRCRCDPERALYIFAQALMVAWSFVPGPHYSVDAGERGLQCLSWFILRGKTW